MEILPCAVHSRNSITIVTGVFHELHQVFTCDNSGGYDIGKRHVDVCSVDLTQINFYERKEFFRVSCLCKLLGEDRRSSGDRTCFWCFVRKRFTTSKCLRRSQISMWRMTVGFPLSVNFQYQLYLHPTSYVHHSDVITSPAWTTTRILCDVLVPDGSLGVLSM